MSRQKLSDLIADACRVTVFTGAGISTESGIPDFRSPGGLWTQFKPIDFQAFVSSEDERREAWKRMFDRFDAWGNARPNAGHAAVARLVEQGKVADVVTQNVDNLHQASGVPDSRVIELHGNASYATCLTCGLRHELEVMRQSFLGRDELPACRECGGIVKVATISFGQAMPHMAMIRAQEAALSCDLFLVLGSSLSVFPAADFPRMAKRNGARLAILNREPTPQDGLADLVLRDEIGPALSQAVAANGPIAI